MRVALLLLALVHTYAETGITNPPLEVGGEQSGSIDTNSPTVTSPQLERYAATATRGVTFEIRVPDTAAYRVELLSHYFDPYLVLRDDEGNVLTEDDDGWLATYPRVIFSNLSPDRSYFVDACAVHGGTGEFEIRMHAGEPEILAPLERAEASVAQAKKSLSIVEEKLDEKDPIVLDRIGDVAYFLNQLGRLDEAMEYHTRALPLTEAIHGKDSIHAGALAHKMGEFHERRTDFEKAAELFQRTITIFETKLGAEHPETAHALSSLGRAYFKQGVYERARPLLERSLEIRRARFGQRNAATAESLRALATLLETIGSYEEARPLYEEALAIVRRIYGSGDARTAAAQAGLALLLKKQGKVERAAELYDQAFSIAEASLVPSSPLLLRIRSNRAVLMSETGNPKEAMPVLETVLSQREASLGDEHPMVSTALNNVAMTALRLDDLDRARGLLERAVAMDKKLLGNEHPSTVLRLSNLATAVAMGGDRKRAVALESESLTARRKILERQLPILSESERFRWVARQHRSLEQLLELTSTTDDAATAYREVVYWKGLVSRGLLQDREWIQKQSDDKLLALQDELATLLSRMSRVFFDDATDPVQQTEELSQLRSRRSELERSISQLAKRSRQHVEVDIDAIVKALEPTDALIDFVSYRGNDDKDKLTVFVARRDKGVQRVDLGDLKPRERWIEKHLDEIKAQRGISAIRPAKKLDTGNLWPDLEPHLDGITRVFVCPEGQIATLPFGTIADKEEGKYLIERIAFVYLQSALDVLPQERQPYGKGALLIGGVDYDYDADIAPFEDDFEEDWEAELERELAADAAAEKAEAQKAEAAAGKIETRAFGRPFMPLDHTLREVKELQYLYGRNKERSRREVAMLTGEEATEPRVKRGVAGKRYVHLATHGFFDKTPLNSMMNVALRSGSADPLRAAVIESRTEALQGLLPGLLTGIILAGANIEDRPRDVDGILTAEELAWLDLRGCQLATLSACESGLGESQAGEHLIGLRRALRLAGARTTVTSLWEVADAPTKNLMRGFYTRLWYKNQGVHEALRGAQLEQLERNRAQRNGQGIPSTWGAFVLEGDWK